MRLVRAVLAPGAVVLGRPAVDRLVAMAAPPVLATAVDLGRVLAADLVPLVGAPPALVDRRVVAAQPVATRVEPARMRAIVRTVVLVPEQPAAIVLVDLAPAVPDAAIELPVALETARRVVSGRSAAVAPMRRPMVALALVVLEVMAVVRVGPVRRQDVATAVVREADHGARAVIRVRTPVSSVRPVTTGPAVGSGRIDRPVTTVASAAADRIVRLAAVATTVVAATIAGAIGVTRVAVVAPIGCRRVGWRHRSPRRSVARPR